MSNLRLKILALVIAVFLWIVAHLSGSAHVERPFDVPVVLTGLSTELVVSSRSTDKVNVTVAGPRSAIRKIVADKMEYVIDVSQARPGEARFDVDLSQLEMPRGTRIIGRSPAQISIQFEKRKNKSVPVQVEQTGALAPELRLTKVEVVPSHVEITGPEREVTRTVSISTEAVDVSPMTGTLETQIRVVPSGKNVQLVTDAPVTVKFWIEKRESKPGPTARPKANGK